MNDVVLMLSVHCPASLPKLCVQQWTKIVVTELLLHIESWKKIEKKQSLDKSPVVNYKKKEKKN